MSKTLNLLRLWCTESHNVCRRNNATSATMKFRPNSHGYHTNRCTAKTITVKLLVKCYGVADKPTCRLPSCNSCLFFTCCIWMVCFDLREVRNHNVLWKNFRCTSSTQWSLQGHEMLGAFAKFRKTVTRLDISVRPSVHTEKLGFHWTDFHEIWCMCIIQKYVEKSPVSLKSHKNNG